MTSMMANRYGFGVDNRAAVDVNNRSDQDKSTLSRTNGVIESRAEESDLIMADPIMPHEDIDDNDLGDRLGDPGLNRAEDSPGASTAKDEQQNVELERQKLATRDMEAVVYSKNMLQEGDTLVFISYPENQSIYNPSGFIVNDVPHVVHSQTLLGIGSKRFETLLSPSNQFRILRRKKLANKLPSGIKYILDLTPPDEGDEAVDLTTALSCSLGIRSWYSIQCRCNMRSKLVDGWDEIAAPRSPSVTATQLSEDTNPAPVVIDTTTTPSRFISMSVFSRSKRDLEEEHTRDMAEAILLSTEMSSKLKEPVVVRRIPEYDPYRHRAGIVRLLQVLEGKDPQLDSAPKIWTLVRLAEYFDCTSSMVDKVLLWILESPNQLFIEILPEAACKIGFTLECELISKGSFAVLVSEEALSLVSRSLGKFAADQKHTNQFGRRLEDVDEDLKTRIEYASKSFAERIQRLAEVLLDAGCAWFDDLPEYRKLEKFKSALLDNLQLPVCKQWLADLSDLQSCLRHYVRGRILSILDQSLEELCVTSSNKHRFLEQYHGDAVHAPSFSMYEKLTHKERVMTRFFWDMLRDISCDLDHVNTAWTNLPKVPHSRNLESYLVESTSIGALRSLQARVNLAILAAIQTKVYADGVIPAECFGVLTMRKGTASGTGKVPGKTHPRSPESQLSWDWADTPDDEDGGLSRARQKIQPCDLPHPTTIGSENDKPDTVTAATGREPEASASLPIRRKSIVSVQKGFERSVVSPSGSLDLTGRQSTKASGGDNVIPTMSFSRHVSETGLGDMDSSILHSLSRTSVPAKSAKDEALSDYAARHLQRDTIGIPAAPLIGDESLFFSLHLFMLKIQDYIESICDRLLETGDLGFDITITDTLMCLDSREFKYLPLWAGGDDDGSGGVFENEIPSAFAGPTGPGPGFHTGFSSASTATSVSGDDSASRATFANTSLAAENGFSDHLDRHRVVSVDGFRSDTFSEDLNSYDALIPQTDKRRVASDSASRLTLDDDVLSFEDSSTTDTRKDDESEFAIIDDPERVAVARDATPESENEMWHSEDAVQFESSDEDIDEDIDEDMDEEMNGI